MKKLTETGKKFIRTICSGTSTNLISGKFDYGLPFSTLENNSVLFTSNAIDHLGNKIITNEQLGEALIFWFNKYAELNNLDANVLAAQTYKESKYRLWYYNQNNSGCGVTNEISSRVYKFIINQNSPEVTEALAGLMFYETELNSLTANTTASTLSTSYIYRGRLTNYKLKETAIKNRLLLYQNMIDNPEILIKLQSNIMKTCALRNNNKVPSALFSYNRNYLLQNKSYIRLVDQCNKKYGDSFTKEGIDYVYDIFRILGDKDNNKAKGKSIKPKGISFGYTIDFTSDNFNTFLG